MQFKMTLLKKKDTFQPSSLLVALPRTHTHAHPWLTSVFCHHPLVIRVCFLRAYPEVRRIKTSEETIINNNQGHPIEIDCTLHNAGRYT